MRNAGSRCGLGFGGLCLITDFKGKMIQDDRETV
jgi:hypothetical protein